MLRYPLAQQCKLLNFSNTEYSFDTVSFVNCMCVEFNDSLKRLFEQFSKDTTVGTLTSIIMTKLTYVSREIVLIRIWLMEIFLENIGRSLFCWLLHLWHWSRSSNDAKTVFDSSIFECLLISINITSYTFDFVYNAIHEITCGMTQFCEIPAWVIIR